MKKSMTRDPARIKPILKRLERIWMDHSDQRLGQLILNSQKLGDLYNMECEEIIENLEEVFLYKMPEKE